MDRELSQQRDEFAQVVIASVACEPLVPEVGQTLTVVVKFINRGRTSAKKVRCVAVVEPVPKGQSPLFSYVSDPVIKLGTIAPSVEHQATLHPVKSKRTGEDGPLTPELFNKLSSGDTQLFVHGRIDYEDISRRSHWTTFCYFLIVPFNGHFGLYDDTHNDTDG